MCESLKWDYSLVIVFASFFGQFLEFGVVWTVGVFNLLFLEAFDHGSGTTALISSLNTSVFYAAGD